jgi:hypothetical protein
VNVLALVIQVVVGVLTVSGSYVAAGRRARETEVRSRREEWWRRFIWAADARSDADAARRQAGKRCWTACTTANWPAPVRGTFCSASSGQPGSRADAAAGIDSTGVSDVMGH